MSDPSLFDKAYSRLSQIWETPEELGRRAVRSGAISFIEKFVLKGAAFIRTVIIARLLTPDDIGLFGLASLAIAVTGVFTQPGLKQAAVQEKGDVNRYLDSVWSAGILRNTVVAALIFAVSAPVAGLFFENEQVVPLIRALALMVFLVGFQNVGVLFWDRELTFNKRFYYNIVRSLTQMVITIVAAVILRDVWALVIGTILGQSLFVPWSYLFHSYRPKFTWDLSGAWRLFRYGKWVGIAGIAMFFVQQGDNLTIGRMLEPESLAYYSMAFALGTLPATEIVGVMSSVLFPLYANLQDDIVRLKRAFIRISRLVFSLSIPASFGLLVLAPEAVEQVYGPRWLPMVPILYVILIYGVFKSFELITDPLFRGMGKPQITTAITVTQALVMFSVIVPLTSRWGAVGAGIAALIGYIIAQGIYLYRLRRDLGIGFRVLGEAFVTPVLASGLMVVALLFAKAHVPLASAPMLLLYVVGGAACYFAALWLVDTVGNGRLFQSYRWVRSNI